MAAPTLSFASVLASDMVTLSAFYREVFDLPEVDSLTSEHFRGLQVGSTVLGFSAASTAYDLLELPRPQAVSGRRPVYSFLTFEVEDDAAVAAHLERAVQRGAGVVQTPHRTYYGAWQAVARDPEENVFRINHLPDLHPAA